MNAPTAQEVRAAREAAGLDRTQAAALIYKSVRSFEKWEIGERPMDPAWWELLLLKFPTEHKEKIEAAIKTAGRKKVKPKK